MKYDLSHTGSFLVSFGVVFFASGVFAINLPDGDPLEATTVAPLVHSIDIAGGSADSTDGDGVSIGNQGTITVVSDSISINNSNPARVYTLDSNKGGINISSVQAPVIGLTSMLGSLIGRIGVEGIVLGSPTGASVTTKGYIGHTRNIAPSSPPFPTDYQALTDNTFVKPYAFYTTQPTYLGGQATFDGTIYSANQVNFTSDVLVSGDMAVEDDVNVEAINLQSAYQLDVKFTTAMTTLERRSDDDDVVFGAPFSAVATCPADAYVVGCSGLVGVDYSTNAVQASDLAPYRGASMSSSNSKGGTCTAWARNQDDFPEHQFTLTAYAYCFQP